MTDNRPASYGDQLAAAKDFILANDDFLVVSHINPDGDAVSSTLAVGWMLSRLGKRFMLANEGSVPAKFDFLKRPSDIMNYSEEAPNRTYACVISVDCADFSRIGKVAESFGKQASMLNIDHHPTNDYFGSHTVIKTDAAATAEILYDLANELETAWSVELADCIYTGLLTDTGGFRYSNTTPNVMRIASEMLDHGVNGNELADRLLEKLSYSQVLLLQKSLSRLGFSPDRRIAWVSVSAEDLAETKASSEDTEGLVNYPRNIEGVEIGLLFKESEPGLFKISLRSSGMVNVAEIAQSYGGGGHIRASGCSLNGTLEEVVTKVVGDVGSRLK